MLVFWNLIIDGAYAIIHFSQVPLISQLSIDVLHWKHFQLLIQNSH